MFPSLSDVECAKMVRDAAHSTKMEFKGIDFERALVYLRIVGGKEHLLSTKLKHRNPVWRGKRPDLVSVGGELSKDLKNWKLRKGDLKNWEKKEIIARTIELAVLVTVGTHVYSFEDKLFVQKSGGPIGMRSTASLANLVMRCYDQAWLKLAKAEGLILDSYSRYVDDCRLVLPSLNLGWRCTAENLNLRI